MAGYDYGNYRSGYSGGGKGAGTYTDQWGNPRYASTDAECLTVIVDADGTQRTVVGCTPFHNPEAYVTKTETIIEERVHSPLLPSYRNGSHPDIVEPVRGGYGYGADNSYQRRPLSPARGGYGNADQPSRIAPSNGMWNQQPHQTGHYNGTSAGYNDYSDYNNKPTTYKHHGKSDNNYDDNYRKNEGGSLGPAVNMISNMASSRAKPSRTHGDGRLSVPTDDMERALHYLRESAKPSPWPRR